jgi:flagellar biosynthesis/type III secretory pathway chaperone
MNRELMDALERNLEEELETQNELVEALRRQRVRLLEGEADGFDLVLDRIRELLERTDRNRDRRAALLRSLGVDPAIETPIETVASAAPPERGERLRGLRRAIVGIAAEVRTLNHFNAQLVRRSAEVVESLLRVFTGLTDVPGYGLSGSRNRLCAGGVLVNAEI